MSHLFQMRLALVEKLLVGGVCDPENGNDLMGRDVRDSSHVGKSPD